MPPSILSRVRTLCLSLPESHEVEAWGAPTFRVKNKLFAMYAASTAQHSRGRDALWVKAAPGQQQLMVSDRPEQFFVPPYVGPSGWVGVYLDRDTDWRGLRDIVTDGFWLVAPKRLLATRTSKRV